VWTSSNVYVAYFDVFVDWCMFTFVPKKIIFKIIVVLFTLWVEIVEYTCVYSLWYTGVRTLQTLMHRGKGIRLAEKDARTTITWFCIYLYTVFLFSGHTELISFLGVKSVLYVFLNLSTEKLYFTSRRILK